MKWRISSGDVGIYLVEICRICRSEKWNTKRATRLWPFWWSETFHFWGSPHDVGLVKSRTPPNYGCSQRENDDKPLEFGAVFFVGTTHMDWNNDWLWRFHEDSWFWEVIKNRLEWVSPEAMPHVHWQIRKNRWTTGYWSGKLFETNP